MAWASPSLSPVSTVHCPVPFKPLPVISQPTTVAKETSRYRRARREDETETDGKEISGLLHRTKCHGEYGSISSWHFVVCCQLIFLCQSPLYHPPGGWYRKNSLQWLLFALHNTLTNVSIQLRSSVLFHWELAATSYSVPFTKFAINLLSQGDIPLLDLTARVAFSQSGSTISLL